MIPGKVCALMATYGRHGFVEEALSCFLDQTYPNRELIILNNHPVHLIFDHPLVRIVNEPCHPTLGHCRNRLLDLADGEFVQTWDDDDLYLPWCLNLGASLIGAHDAWKPAKSWVLNAGNFSLHGNAMEASIICRTEAVRRIGGYQRSAGDEHAPLLKQLKIVEGDVGWWSGYCYRWGNGAWHISGSLGSEQTVQQRTAEWYRRNLDARPNLPLCPPDMRSWWRKMALTLPAPERDFWLHTATDGHAHVPPPLQVRAG